MTHTLHLMRNLKFISTIAVVFFCLVSFAQNKPDIKIKQVNDSFDIRLKVDNINEIKKIKVQGFSFAKGSSNNFQMEFDANKLKSVKSKEIEHHKLGLNTDYALYTITTYNSNGEAKQLPSLKINMPAGYSNGNKL